MGLMSWLGLGNTKRDKMIADYLSDIAVAVIGEGDKLEISRDYKVSNTFDKIKENSDEMDSLFIEPLKSLLYSGSKYMTLWSHFKMFKQAHLNPIIGTLIADSSLRNLVLGHIRVKLCEYMSLSEAKEWRKYHEGILDYLGPCLANPGGGIGDYEYGIASAFADSAHGLNPETLTMQDCFCFREKKFSTPLIKILAEHFQIMRMTYMEAVRSI